MKRLYVVMIGMAVALFGVSSQAASLDFVMGGASSATVDDSSASGGNVTAVVNPALEGLDFSLVSGASREVSFFDLVFDCQEMLCGGSFDVAATLDFASPVASASGSADNGMGISLLGVLTAGVLQWTQPGVISTGLGDFSVVFEDLAEFVQGSALTVHATITALGGGDVSPVPLPPAVWLFLTALLMLAGFNSRKRRGAHQPLPAH